MKRITTKYILALAVTLGVTLCAQAQPLAYTFPTSTNPGFTGWNWAAASPNGDMTGGALQANYTASGWQQSAQVDFGVAGTSQNGNYNGNADIFNMLSAGPVNVSFNIIVDGATTFAAGASDWYKFTMIGNSLGGWKQQPDFGFNDFGNTPGSGTGWHNAGDTSIQTYAMSYTSTQLGWTAAAGDYYQLIFVGNSGSSPFDFYIDDLTISPVPEPTTLALAGLGAAALLIFRRRK